MQYRQDKDGTKNFRINPNWLLSCTFGNECPHVDCLHLTAGAPVGSGGNGFPVVVVVACALLSPFACVKPNSVEQI